MFIGQNEQWMCIRTTVFAVFAYNALYGLVLLINSPRDVPIFLSFFLSWKHKLSFEKMHLHMGLWRWIILCANFYAPNMLSVIPSCIIVCVLLLHAWLFLPYMTICMRTITLHTVMGGTKMIFICFYCVFIDYWPVSLSLCLSLSLSLSFVFMLTHFFYFTHFFLT